MTAPSLPAGFARKQTPGILVVRAGRLRGNKPMTRRRLVRVGVFSLWAEHLTRGAQCQCEVDGESLQHTPNRTAMNKLDMLAVALLPLANLPSAANAAEVLDGRLGRVIGSGSSDWHLWSIARYRSRFASSPLLFWPRHRKAQRRTSRNPFVFSISLRNCPPCWMPWVRCR
ncbi:MAG: hypothetical protein JWL90_2071 [Chthoniobacteraceae bacterium]|nr:hypothetical protein [Chthoniobacteraceae bacterium]